MNNTIDELFAFDQNSDGQEREKEIFDMAKKKSNRKMITVSLVVFLIIMALCTVLKMQLTPYMVGKNAMEKDVYYSLHGANSYVSMWDSEYKLLGSSSTATQYRLIEGIPVYERQLSLGPLENPILLNQGESLDWQDNQYGDTYYLNGNKAMQFFLPSINYPTYTRDFSKLNNMPTTTLAEMALSFDQSYTLDELEALLPSGVTLAWNWVNSFPEEPVTSELKQVFWGHEVFGFSMTDKSGVNLADPITEFKEQLQFCMSKGGSQKETFASIYKLFGSEDMTVKSVPIIGAVVTGSPESLAGLEGLSFIKGASLGETVTKY